jgi:hypothetical protein
VPGEEWNADKITCLEIMPDAVDKIVPFPLDDVENGLSGVPVAETPQLAFAAPDPKAEPFLIET